MNADVICMILLIISLVIIIFYEVKKKKFNGSSITQINAEVRFR